MAASILERRQVRMPRSRYGATVNVINLLRDNISEFGMLGIISPLLHRQSLVLISLRKRNMGLGFVHSYVMLL